MLLIFVIAAVDSIRLLHQMRADSRILRTASLERSRRLASVRYYILLHLRGRRPADHSELRDALARALENLDGYQTSTLAETTLLQNLRVLLEQDRLRLDQPHPSTSLLESDTNVQ